MSGFRRRHGYLITFLVLLFVGILVLVRPSGGIQQLRGYTMGTTYRIQIVDMPAALSSSEIAADVSALLLALDTGIFSTYAANSELSRFNRAPLNQPFAASAELLAVLTLAKEISELSDGAFDVTVGGLVNLWGFGPSIQALKDAVPEQQEIDSQLQSVGYELLKIDQARREITRLAEFYVDLSGIAKGYAVDQLAVYFDAAGVENYFLEIGGELRIKGEKPGGTSWVPAIETPQDSSPQVYEVFFTDGAEIAIAGSGDYRNYFEVDGQRYSHEIDPRNGRPVSHNLAAVYVIDDSAARADALATAYMVLGLEGARELAQRTAQAAYFIYSTDGVEFQDYVTPEFANYLRSD